MSYGLMAACLPAPLFKEKQTMPAKIRKIIVQADAVHIEMGQAVVPPKRRALAMVVIKNPYAGAYSKNFDALLATGEELGTPPPLRPTLQTAHGVWRA